MEEKLNHSPSPFNDLIDLIETLRGDKGCPWDKKQTPKSLSRYLAEEVFELLDAIQADHAEDICEELGDVLFLVLFLATQFQSQGIFDIQTLIERNKEKMTRRHPHVFGKETADTPQVVRERWNDIKRREKSNTTEIGTLGKVPKSMPALFRAYLVSSRAAATGFDWDDLKGVMKTAEEEWQELNQELDKQTDHDNKALILEIGDILFTLVNVARLAGIHPENALSASTQKFESRFTQMEKLAESRQENFEALSFEDKHRLWDEVKKSEIL